MHVCVCVCVQRMQVLFKDKMNVLLLLLPFAIVSKAVGWAAGPTFILSLLPLCSLAEVGLQCRCSLLCWLTLVII